MEVTNDPYTHTDPHVDPASRWFWPDAPPTAGFDASHGVGLSGYSWHVEGVAPPAPWPYVAEWPVDAYGPPGTVWRVPANAYAERVLTGSSLLTRAAASQLLRLNKLPRITVVPLSPVLWTTPGRIPDAVTINVLRATIHAKIGSDEEACNVLHYVPDPDDAITDAMVATFGAKIAGAWGNFIGATLPNVGSTVASRFSSLATWDEVRAAHVQIVDGVVKWAPGANTHFVDMATDVKGTGSPLPNQIACAISLLTGVRAGKRGRSGRGRTFLGPLATQAIDSNGLFSSGLIGDLSFAWYQAMNADMASGSDKFKLCILSPKTDARYLVTDMVTGLVPDTQRRRRRSRLEQYRSPAG